MAGIDPISAIANAVGAVANAATYIGAGKRQQRDRLGARYRLEDFQQPTSQQWIVLAGVALLMVVIIAVTWKKLKT